MSDPGPNIFEPEWQRELNEGPFGMRGSRVGADAGASKLGAAVYEICLLYTSPSPRDRS